MSKAPLIWISLSALVVLGIGYLVLTPSEGQRQSRQLDSSLIGVEGLVKWLPENDVRVVRSNPRLTPNVNNLSIQILPLYDVNLNDFEPPPATKDAEMLQSTQRDLEEWMFTSKLYSLRTLVVLPKWRTGFIRSKVAHDTTQIPMARMETLNAQLYLPSNAVFRLDGGFITRRLSMRNGPERNVSLYHAQLFRTNMLPVRCTPLLSIREGALLIRCNSEDGIDRPVAYYLSDPDLLNNHGLSLAENASFAADMIKALRVIDAPDETRAIYLDTSTELLLITNDYADDGQTYERGETEFARFFEYPLSVLWAVAGVILALGGWRGLRRFGPAARPVEDTLEQSKTVGIDAKARLLRISGNDGRMVGEFVRARLDALAEAAFGAGGPAVSDATHERLFKLLSRRDPALVDQFRTVSNDLIARGAEMPKAELYHWLETFRDLLERLNHGPDPISKPD